MPIAVTSSASNSLDDLSGQLSDISTGLDENEILSRVRDHLSIVDTDYIYRAVNNAYLRAHQLAREQIVGRNVADLLGEDKFHSLVKPNLDRCFCGQEIHYQGEFLFKAYDQPVYMDVGYYPKLDGNNNIVGAVVAAHDITRLKREEERLSRLAFVDTLTGLPNRAFALYEIDKAIAAAERHGHSFTLIFADLDHFKEVNDRFGHGAGDQVLHQVAGRLKQVLRADEFIARLGGDEFVILLPHGAEPQSLESLQKRLKSALQEPVQIASPLHAGGHTEHYLGISLGGAVYPLDASNAEALFQVADSRMYQDKDH